MMAMIGAQVDTEVIIIPVQNQRDPDQMMVSRAVKGLQQLGLLLAHLHLARLCTGSLLRDRRDRRTREVEEEDILLHHHHPLGQEVLRVPLLPLLEHISGK
jgi:hypothetical protein